MSFLLLSECVSLNVSILLLHLNVSYHVALSMSFMSLYLHVSPSLDFYLHRFPLYSTLILDYIPPLFLTLTLLMNCVWPLTRACALRVWRCFVCVSSGGRFGGPGVLPTGPDQRPGGHEQVLCQDDEHAHLWVWATAATKPFSQRAGSSSPTRSTSSVSDHLIKQSHRQQGLPWY